MLYVDDLQVSCQGSDMRLIERQLQLTVNRLVKWCDQNGHTISPSKSSCVHFCRKRNLHPEPFIHIGNIQIPVVSAVCFLKVIFDCKLTFLPHVLYLRKKKTVWCALLAGGIIGPYFFKNDEGHNVTVNGDRYRAMITNFFIPELNNHDVQELWFQQDGATCHTACATIDLLKDTFGDRLISRFGPVNWPPRSCDLTPLDYFLSGYVKSLVYANKPQMLDHLEANIRPVIADIRPQMLEKVIENWTSRLEYIRASRGSHMPEIIFKM
ncbi:uncharacterized protein TNCV_2316131 [Trichonephila clavipes]|nr:uncharacterized protein TNCV_2316131 [Trichonephila clavipes]